MAKNYEVVVVAKGLQKDGGQVIKSRFLINAESKKNAFEIAKKMWKNDMEESDFHITDVLLEDDYRNKYLKMAKGGSIKVGDKVRSTVFNDISGEVISKKGEMLMVVGKNKNNPSKVKHEVLRVNEVEKMANGGTTGLSDKEKSIIEQYKKTIVKLYNDLIARTKERDSQRIYTTDLNDHLILIDRMKRGSWKNAWAFWNGMDSIPREKITNGAYDLLMKKNNITSYAKGGEVDSSAINKLWEGYAEAVLFTEVDMDTDESLDSQYSIYDFDEKTVKETKKMLGVFYSQNKEAIQDSGLDLNTIGNDIWYTRSGQGAGFFDHSLDDDVEQKLINGANALGEYPSVEVYNGKISIRGGRVFAKGGKVISQFRVTSGRGGGKETWVISHPKIEQKGVYFKSDYSESEAKNHWYENVFQKYEKGFYAKGGSLSGFNYSIGGL